MRIASRWRLWAAACVAAFAAVAQGDEKHLWAELIAFDNASADFGVAACLSRMPVKPRGLSLLLADPEIVHAHAGLSRDFPLGDSQCSYFARPWNEERARQSWTAYQLRGLVAELKRHEVEVYPSFFDVSMAADSGYLKRFGAVRKPGFWIDSHPEVLCQARDGSRQNGVCVIKRLSDGTFYRDFFARQLVRFLKDYGFAGWHACDGYGHPRVPVSEGDFSDDVISQFVAEAPAMRPPDGLSFTARADWILSRARPDWCRFHARRHADFITACARALKAEGLTLRLNTCWTCDPFEALYRYGVDYRLLEKSGIDGFYAEQSATVLTLEGWVSPPISKLDRCRAATIRSAAAVDVPLLQLACVKDGMEQYNALRHAPALVAAEIIGLQALFRNVRPAMSGVLWCLADGITADEWRRLDGLWTLLPAAQAPDGVRVVWSDGAQDAELDAYCRDRTPSSFALLAELLHRGAVVCSGVRVEEALADEAMPLLLLNPGLMPAAERAALVRRTAPVVQFGVGAPECPLGPNPQEPEPASWLSPLPMRTPLEAAFARAVAAVNAVAPAVPAAGMADLRVMSYRAANGARVVIALNDRAMYLDARIRLKGVPRDVRALTASPSLPVGVRPVEDGACVLSAKIPPQGVVVLACRFEKAEEIKP